MTVKIIAENILVPDDFSSATEQEGEFIGQPIPASDNAGAFRLLSKGTIADFSYSGTATGNGNTLTMVDSVLAAFGDNYFIGATIEFTGGENTSGTKTITDFAQATGTLTWVGAINATLIGDTFTLTVPFSTRDYRVELVSGGDAGDATFKWSHDGGSAYFGRDDPDQANWLYEHKIRGTGGDINLVASHKRLPMVQADDGYYVVMYFLVGNNVYTRKTLEPWVSLTWDSSALAFVAGTPKDLIKLSSGRLLASADQNAGGFEYIAYSDDNADSWTRVNYPIGSIDIGGLAELPNGNVIMVYETSSVVYAVISIDQGISWGSPITVASDANSQKDPSVRVAANGDIICAYESDEDAVNDYDIKCKISSTGGATWGSSILVMDFSTNSEDLGTPSLVVDINEDVYCVAAQTPTTKILLAKSTTNGASWAAFKELHDPAFVCTSPFLMLDNRGTMYCTFVDDDSDKPYFVQRGIWETFSGNACPCAIEAIEQKLINDVGIVWHGGAGIAADDWSFTPDYDYSMKNLIEDSPSKSFRSTQDNISCNIVIDLGTYERFRATGVAFFGCNVRQLDFQMNASDSWGGPSIDETISFQVTTGASDADDGNTIQDTSLLANYKDHHFKNYYLRMTSGGLSGTTWKIKDNVGAFFILDVTTDISAIANADTFEIFQPFISATFTGGNYRFMRISIDAHHTAEDYYELGTMVVGEALSLEREIGKESKAHQYGIEMLRPAGGGLIPIVRYGRKVTWGLKWVAAETVRLEMAALLDYIEGKNLALIPDSSDLKDCYLLKLISHLTQAHDYKEKYNISMEFEEVL